MRAPQGQEGTCEVEHAVRPRRLRLHAHAGRIARKGKPRLHALAREPCVRASIPKHRGPLRIAAEPEARDVLSPRILDKLGRDLHVLHPQLVSVVQGRRPPEGEEEEHRRARRCRSDPARDTGFIVIAEHPVRPRTFRQRSFHLIHRASHRLGRPGHVEQGEIEGHVELVQLGAVISDELGEVEEMDLADGDPRACAAESFEQAADVAIDEVRVRVSPIVDVELRAVLPHVLVEVAPPRRRRRVVAELRVLHHRVRDVDAESIHATLEPELQRAQHRPTHLGVAPVQVWLLLQEGMQVVLARPRIPGPGGPAEGRQPVVRQRAVRLRVAPHVPVPPRVLAAAAGREEPCVLVAGVVGHPIDDDR